MAAQLNIDGSPTQILHSHVRRGAFKLRADKNVFQDVTLQEQLMALLFSYNNDALKLGLQAICGADICWQANKLMLKQFICLHLLGVTPANTQQLLHYNVTFNTGKEKSLMRDIETEFIHKVLSLVYILDLARKQVVGFPCLFLKESAIKSSAELLIELNRCFFAAEENIIKHLESLHFVVSVKQRLVEETQAQVSDLSKDLRDGVVLGRLVENLSAQKVVTAQEFRFPAVDLHLKKRNVAFVMQTVDKLLLHSQQQQQTAPAAATVVVNNNGKKKVKASVFSASAAQNQHKQQQAAVVNTQKLKDEKLVKAVVEGNKQETMWLLTLISYMLDTRLNLVNNAHVIREVNRLLARCGSQCVYDASSVTSIKQSLFYWCKAVLQSHAVETTAFGHLCTDSADEIIRDVESGELLCILVSHYFPKLLSVDRIAHSSTISDAAILSATNAHLLQAASKQAFASTQVHIPIPYTQPSNHQAELCLLIESRVVVFLGQLFNRIMQLRTEANAERVIRTFIRLHLSAFREKVAAKRAKRLQALEKQKQLRRQKFSHAFSHHTSRLEEEKAIAANEIDVNNNAHVGVVIALTRTQSALLIQAFCRAHFKCLQPAIAVTVTELLVEPTVLPTAPIETSEDIVVPAVVNGVKSVHFSRYCVPTPNMKQHESVDVEFLLDEYFTDDDILAEDDHATVQEDEETAEDTVQEVVPQEAIELADDIAENTELATDGDAERAMDVAGLSESMLLVADSECPEPDQELANDDDSVFEDIVATVTENDEHNDYLHVNTAVDSEAVIVELLSPVPVSPKAQQAMLSPVCAQAVVPHGEPEITPNTRTRIALEQTIEELRLQANMNNMQTELRLEALREEFLQTLARERMTRELTEATLTDIQAAKVDAEERLRSLEQAQRQRELDLLEQSQRQLLEQQQLARANKAVVCIQSVWRMSASKKYYKQVVRKAIVKMQSTVRAYVAHKWFRIQKLSVSLIQSVWRRNVCVYVLRTQRQMAIEHKRRRQSLITCAFAKICVFLKLKLRKIVVVRSVGRLKKFYYAFRGLWRIRRFNVAVRKLQVGYPRH
jgi:hypothetical protein